MLPNRGSNKCHSSHSNSFQKQTEKRLVCAIRKTNREAHKY